MFYNEYSSYVTSLHYAEPLHQEKFNPQTILCLPNQIFHIIYMPEMRVEFCKGNTEQLLGYPPDRLTLSFLYEITHPDDRETVLQAAKTSVQYSQIVKATTPFAHTFCIDFRLRKADGTYIRVLKQWGVLENDSAGNMIRGFTFYTEITFLKKTNTIRLALFGPDRSKVEFPLKEWDLFSFPLTKTEMAIVEHLALGFNSQQIATWLNVSKHTVDTHRRNILRKSGLRNTAEIIALAKERGLI